MVAYTSPSANLSLTVAHAVAFLTRPLIASHPAVITTKLRSILEANLIAFYAPSWVVQEPLHGSGRRCLTLSPDYLPPRPIYSACTAAGIQWFEWISLLGNQEFDFFVDPGCVSLRCGQRGMLNGKFITIWVEEVASSMTNACQPLPEGLDGPKATQLRTSTHTKCSKTLAQQLLEDDHEDDERIFAMIADEISAPTWTTPVDAHFPTSIRSLSPLSAISSHSRSSSRSSNSSSCFSFTSAESSITSLSSTSSPALPDPKWHKQSRRERARQARVFVDTSKTEVTPYDGGKTTVLTGGVMLGSHQRDTPKANRAGKPTRGNVVNWRSDRL